MDKHLQVQGLRRMIRPVLLDSLAAMSVTCYMFVILCIDSSKSFNDFSFQKVHVYKTKIIMTAATFTSPGPKEDDQACFVVFLGCYVCYLLYVCDTLY